MDEYRLVADFPFMAGVIEYSVDHWRTHDDVGRIGIGFEEEHRHGWLGAVRRVLAHYGFYLPLGVRADDHDGKRYLRVLNILDCEEATQVAHTLRVPVDNLERSVGRELAKLPGGGTTHGINAFYAPSYVSRRPTLFLRGDYANFFTGLLSR